MTLYVYSHGKKSRVGTDAPSVVGFQWLLAQLVNHNAVDPNVAELRHTGLCGRCGRALTVPESIDTGFGPRCAAALGIAWTRVDDDLGFGDGHRSGSTFDDHPLEFLLAGRAVVTVRSKATGTRYTYRVKRAPGEDRRAEHGRRSRPWFVAVLAGPENTRDYAYLGVIRAYEGEVR
jgi:hypothetical protein